MFRLPDVSKPSPQLEARCPGSSRNIHRLMIVSGVLTFTMVYATIAPDGALLGTFGASLEGPVADIVVRNWEH